MQTEDWEFFPSISTQVFLVTYGFCLFGSSRGGNFYYLILVKAQIAFSYMDKNR